MFKIFNSLEAFLGFICGFYGVIMKKIFVVTQVQNEADIIESFCRYYCSFCDGILVIDNMSSDNTFGILNSLADEGLPVFVKEIQNFGLNKKYPSPALQRINYAIEHHDADIILPIDGDEFLISANGGNPRAVLEGLDETIEYHIKRRNYVCPPEIKDNTVFYPCNTSKYAPLSSPKTVMSRFLIKDKNAFPSPGCHFFRYTEDCTEVKDSSELYYNHYPFRTAHQFMKKAVLKWINYLTYPYYDGSIHHRRGWHYKAFCEEIKKHGVISEKMLERCSVYTTTHIPDENNYTLLNESFDTSFCCDKLKLRYTDYDIHKSNFISMLITQLEKDMRNIPSWRPAMEREIAGEQLGQANATIHHLNTYIETLQKNTTSPFELAGTFYFDTGKNFNEEETVRFKYTHEEKQFYQEVILPQNTVAIRFDPVEGCGCFLQNLIITSGIGELLDYQILNGSKSENGGIVFTTTDPQILIDISNNDTKKIIIQCDIWFFERST